MDKYRLRIKHPSGAEFEAEGSEDFIASEKHDFLSKFDRQSSHRQSLESSLKEDKSHAFWQNIVESRDNLYILKAKSPEISPIEASLIIISASQATGQNDKISAINLSKSLKISGYEPERLDRLLSKKIKQGEIIASGSKRNRLYKLNQKGIQNAYMAIQKLKKAIES
ncbi:MAG: hypothetical protein L6420_05030 [Elusimicrobia bacterium]|nr:hypothetical protein [Elusimicrobiota bacterium]